jgi:hypothetical protein
MVTCHCHTTLSIHRVTLSSHPVFKIVFVVNLGIRIAPWDFKVSFGGYVFRESKLYSQPMPAAGRQKNTEWDKKSKGDSIEWGIKTKGHKDEST